MSKYEILYIINANASDDAKQAVIDKLESIVTGNGRKRGRFRIYRSCN